MFQVLQKPSVADIPATVQRAVAGSMAAYEPSEGPVVTDGKD